jgi:hypothetical protein
MLKKEFIRDGTRRIIGSVTAGYSDTSAVVRDEGNRMRGALATVFTRPATVAASWLPSDPGLLIRKR